MGRNNIDIHGEHFEAHVNLKGFLHMTLRGLLDPAGEDTTVIPRLTKIIRSGITFVSRNLRYPKRDFP